MALKLYSLFSRTDRSCKQKSGTSVTNSRTSMDEDGVFEDASTTDLTPLSAVADAFEELSALVKAKGFNYDIDLKVSDLEEASESFGTLNNILDFDVQNDTVRSPGSLSRNLRRVRQGLDLIRALFQNFLSSEDCCVREAASTAYTDTCAAYHTWAVRTAVYAGMYALPTRDQLILKLNETDESAEREMIRYINASLPVIQYIDKLYTSRDISLDW